MITSARLPAMHISVSIGTLGASLPNRRNITTFLIVLSCLYLFYLDLTARSLDRFSRFTTETTCFRARMVVLGVRTMGDYIWGRYAPKKSPKIGVNRQFQAKTAKYKNRDISKSINGIKTKFEDQAETGNCTSWVV